MAARSRFSTSTVIDSETPHKEDSSCRTAQLAECGTFLTEIAHIHDEVVRANDLYWQVLLQGTAAKSVTLNVIIAARPKGWV